MNILKNKNELDKLIGEYQTDLTRLCYSLCKNHADAEDLYQETWLKAIKYYEKYNRLKPFDKWLFAICVNTFKDKMKSQSFKQAMQFETNEKKEDFISQIPDKSEKSELYSELLDIIAELPEKYQIILTLRYFRDYSERDVAKILGIPLGTVKSRLNKAKS